MMKVEVFSLNKIQPYKNNPRKNKASIDAVVESIKQFGYTQPILIDQNNVIIAGHSRYQACKKLKLKEVACIRLGELSEQQLKAYRIVDNSTGDIAGWDYEKLKLEFDDLEEFDFDLLGLTEQEFFKTKLYEDPDEDLISFDERVKEKREKKCPHCGGSL